MRRVISIFCGVMVAAALAEQQPYERYQTIVDRQMFGPPPAGFDPTKMPSEVAKTKGKADQELSQEQEQIKKAIKFSVLNVTSEGEIVVGFSDNGDAKNPLHYYLKVGESQNGWTVKEADKDEATMTIANKEGIEVTLRLGGDSASDANAVSRTGVANNTRTMTANGSTLLGNRSSLRDRRRQREEQREAEAKKREEEDKARTEREEIEKQQREAEREEQRNQLMQIQNELRKVREAREAQQKQAQGEASSDEQSAETPKESE